MYTANNDPWGHTADNDPLDDALYHGSYFAPGFRAARLAQSVPALFADGPTDVVASQALQLDVVSPLAQRWRPRLAAALADTDDATLREAGQVIAAWDGRATRDSGAATLFRYWLAFVAHRTLADDLGLLFEAIDEAQPVTMTKLTLLAHEQGAADLLDGDAAAILRDALADAWAAWDGRGRPAWGQVHVAEFKTPDRQTNTLATDGDDSTLNVAQSRCWADGALTERCVSEAGAVYRRVTTFAADGTPQTWMNWPKGNAGTDEEWVEGRFERLPFTPTEVAEATVRTEVLTP